MTGGRVSGAMTLCAALLLVSSEASSGQARCESVGRSRIAACFHAGDGPTIVLAAGAGQDSRTWAHLLPDLVRIGNVITFDRPGLGDSPEVEGARTPTAIANEIREVLDHFGVREPVLLVGHSMGGVHVLRLADLFPEVALGILLLDTPPAGFERERMTLLSPDEQERRRAVLAAGRARAPRIVGRERDGAEREPRRFDGVPEEAPLIVVVGDSQDFGHPTSQAEHRTLWRTMSERWLELSRASDLVVAEGSGHMIHVDRPDLVLNLLLRLRDLAR